MTMKAGTKIITFRISEELHNEISQAAKNEERSINNFVTYAVKEYIKNKKQNEKK